MKVVVHGSPVEDYCSALKGGIDYQVLWVYYWR